MLCVLVLFWYAYTLINLKVDVDKEVKLVLVDLDKGDQKKPKFLAKNVS